MKEKFLGYYPKEKQIIDKIWEDGVFIFDTNVLLNLYRYSSTTRDSFLEILNIINDRSWIPFQVGSEFFANRLEVIHKQENLYNTIENLLNFQIFKENLMQYKDRHFSINIEKLISILSDAELKIEEELNESKFNDVKYSKKDILLIKIFDLFDGKIGALYSESELDKLYKIGKQQYQEKVPPGYKDNSKKTNEKYNDFIIWMQVIDYAKEKQRPIIFVTDDKKEDWWQIYKGKTLGPRPELIQEVYNKAKVNCLIYRSTKFIEYASERFNLNQQQMSEVIEEIASLPDDSNREDSDEQCFIEITSDKYLSAREKFVNALNDKWTIKLLVFGESNESREVINKAIVRAKCLPDVRRVLWIPDPQILTEQENKIYRQEREDINICSLDLDNEPIGYYRLEDVNTFFKIERIFLKGQIGSN